MMEHTRGDGGDDGAMQHEWNSMAQAGLLQYDMYDISEVATSPGIGPYEELLQDALAVALEHADGGQGTAAGSTSPRWSDMGGEMTDLQQGSDAGYMAPGSYVWEAAGQALELAAPYIASMDMHFHGAEMQPTGMQDDTCDWFYIGDDDDRAGVGHRQHIGPSTRPFTQGFGGMTNNHPPPPPQLDAHMSHRCP